MIMCDEILKKCNADCCLVINSATSFYFTGYNCSNCYIIFAKGKKYYLTDDRFFAEARELLSDYQVVSISQATTYAIIRQILCDNNCRKLGFDNDIMYSDYLLLKKELSMFEFVECAKQLQLLRAIKTEKQIASIVKAQRIAEKSLNELFKLVKVGVTERELAFNLEYIMAKNGSEGVSFESIIAFAENTAKPHAHQTQKKLEPNCFITFDIGCKFEGFCSDMTRTVAFGDVDSKMIDIYNTVLLAQQTAIDKIKAGITCAEADSYSRDVIAQKGYGNYFLHSLGHGVGVEVHEFPRLAQGSNDILLPNMVVTVEPGIYIDGFAGVRIEDMIVVKENGNVNLTTSDKNLIILR
ncbi:MAG: aminopeptidase P family protein [Clostridia bacterium]